MPTYAYACKDCSHAFDIVQSFTDSSLTSCPECQGTLRKKFNSVGVVFKGSGFYRTDSRDAKGSTVSPHPPRHRPGSCTGAGRRSCSQLSYSTVFSSTDCPPRWADRRHAESGAPAPFSAASDAGSTVVHIGTSAAVPRSLRNIAWLPCPPPSSAPAAGPLPPARAARQPTSGQRHPPPRPPQSHVVAEPQPAPRHRAPAVHRRRNHRPSAHSPAR